MPPYVKVQKWQKSRSLGWTSLHHAAYSQDLHWAKDLLKESVDVNASDRFGRTALSLAAANGNIEFTTWLLDHGSEINRGFPAHYASEKGHTELVQYLIENGVNVNLVKDNNYPLIIAATHGHFAVAKVLIENGADVNATDETDATALHSACLSENLDLISLLTDCGADIDAKDKFDTTPLSVCLIHKENNPELVKLLLAKGASVNMVDVQKSTALHSSGHPISTLELIKYGADVNARDIRNETPLFSACEMEHTECAKILLEHKADPNVRASGGGTALHAAVKNDTVELVKELLKWKANVNATNAQNVIPLHIAAKNGHVEVATELLKQGSLIDVAVIDIADVNSCSYRYIRVEGVTPTTIAESSKHHQITQLLQNFRYSLSQTDADRSRKEIVTAVKLNVLETVKKLNPNDAEITAGDSIGWTLLHHSVWNGCFDISSELVRKGASTNALDNYDRTPLSLAAARNDVETIKLLVENGADVNLGLPIHYAMLADAAESVLELIKYNCDINIKNKSIFESSALIEVASEGKSKIVEILLENKANVNDVNKFGQTALHNACQFNDIQSVRLLIKHGANVNAVDGCKDIPLICAASNSSSEVVKVLIEHGGDINWKDSSLWTPLHRTMYTEGSVRELINAGADVNYYNDNVESPLYLAASQPKIMKILLESNADAHFSAFGGWSVLHESAFSGSLECVKQLLDKNVDVNIGSAENVLPIYLACINGCHEVAEELLKRGSFVDPCIIDVGVIRTDHIMFPMKKSHRIVPGNTPVIGSASAGHLEVVRLLHSYGANLEAVNVKGNTALHEAVLGEFGDIVEFLVRKNVDVNVKNKEGKTALDLAKEQLSDSIVTMLV